MGEPVSQRCGSCKIVKLETDFSPSYRGKPGTWCRTCFAAYARQRSSRPVAQYEPLVCTQCGGQYVPRQMKVNAKNYCSRLCKEKARNARWAVENEAKKPPVRICIACGTDMPPTKRSDAKYCTDECGEAARNVARYNKTRGADVEEIFTLDDIYARDNGVCYLCHQDCPRAAASMEHVIPIGSPHYGPHNRANVRLAHVRCNSRKANKLLSELPWYHPLP